MDERMKRLIAIGASIGANCHPCVEFHINKALDLGIGKGEILEAVDQAKAVRKGAAASMDAFVLKLLDKEATSGCGTQQKSSCGCS
jgi:AhpD family alkylhydroperoxidase